MSTVQSSVPLPVDAVPEAYRDRVSKALAFALEFTLNPVQAQIQAGLTTAANASISAPLLSIQQTAQQAINIGVLCRVYVGSIYFELTEQDVRTVFEAFGFIKNINMSFDPTTNKHKGYCFVEYETAEAAALALDTMNGAILGGRQLRVGRPNNYPANLSSIGLSPAPASRIYVSNVHPKIGEKDMEAVFEAFGKILGCVLIPNPVTATHKGYGFIEFETDQAAQLSIQAMNGFNLGGMQLRVGVAIIGGPLPTGMSSLSAVIHAQQSVNTRMAMLPSFAHSLSTSTTMLGRPDESLNAEENLSIRSSSQRQEIMQKLARGTDLEPSKVLLLRNMVTADDVDPELEQDIRDECSKYGSIQQLSIHAEPEKPVTETNTNVKIFVKFLEAADVARGLAALNGRWFAGRRVRAEVYDEVRFTKGDLSG